MNWKGPVTISELLDRCLDSSFPKLPESNGVYLISRKTWDKQPTQDCIPLYVGSNTGKSNRFRTRVGDMIADMFGFFGMATGHHSGGQKLYKYCMEQQLNPKELHLGWVEECSCVRCAENAAYDQFRPTLINKNRPTRCTEHKS